MACMGLKEGASGCRRWAAYAQGAGLRLRNFRLQPWGSAGAAAFAIALGDDQGDEAVRFHRPAQQVALQLVAAQAF